MPPPSSPRAVTLDKATKVNVGILIVLLGASVGGATYLSTLNNNVLNLAASMQEVRKAIDRNTNQLVNDGKALAILETLVTTIDKRVDALEAKTRK